jgi:Ni,Fe-hydrogenase III large subunit
MSRISSLNVRAMIKKWLCEVEEIKGHLFEAGSRADSLEYNLLSCRAMALLECVNDASMLLIIPED